MTQVWFRNPHNYIRELVEARAKNVAWDRGMLHKRRIDPHKHAMLYFTSAGIIDWRVLLVGSQGSVEMGPHNTLDNPVGVYPTWEGHESLELLEEMMSNPIGEDEQACNDKSVEIDERPVFGQEHRVIVTDLPVVTSGSGRALIRKLKELQEDYPECILHVHGVYSWRVGFGFGFAATDVDPRMDASKGRVILPSGKIMIAEKTIGCPQWVTMLGHRVVELKDPRMRCIYNIKSALWAGEHYMENIKFKATGDAPVDPEAKTHVPATTGSHLSAPAAKAGFGDKIACDTCSLQNTCKYYRQGAVCSVPGAEPAELAKYFKTRDSHTIVEGLGTLLAAQTRRMERGMREEEDYGEMSPEVTKMMNQIFTNGVKLAQLIDPGLRGGAKVQVNVNNGQAQLQAATPNQVIASIIAEFEARGIPRDKVTPEMLENMLSEMSGQPQSIGQHVEGQVIANAGA